MEAAAIQINLPDFVDVENASAEQMEKVRAYQKESEEQGGLLTQAQANAVLGVSSSRVAQLVKAGTLESYEHFGKKLISCDQLIAYARLEKISGSLGSTLVRLFKNSLQKDS
jgi:predicted XRE-type DNA-binding protein